MPGIDREAIGEHSLHGWVHKWGGSAMEALCPQGRPPISPFFEVMPTPMVVGLCTCCESKREVALRSFRGTKRLLQTRVGISVGGMRQDFDVVGYRL